MIIDFHTHTFPEKISARVVDQLGRVARTDHFTDGSSRDLLRSMKEGGITYSVNQPVMTTKEQVEKVNRSLISQKEALDSQGILTFGGMHPDYENYKKELAFLKDQGILGIKLHPAYQNCDLDDIRMMRIIDQASNLGLIVLTHAGIDIGIYEHNYASVKMILKVLKEVQPKKFVLAHMGNWACWEDVKRDLAGAPVWMDTAFSIGDITPNPAQPDEVPYRSTNLNQEEFVSLARKHGMDRILFGTDSPWEDQGGYVKRMEEMPLSQQEKDGIFYKNAQELLEL